MCDMVDNNSLHYRVFMRNSALQVQKLFMEKYLSCPNITRTDLLSTLHKF